jgi:4-hydroxy-3-methylbut-2-enyl diphosphate reductase
VDATCPFVQRAQRLAQELVREGYSLVLLGDPAHPEIQGILGTVQEAASVVSTPDQISALPEQKRYGLIAQTTQSLENLQRVASALLARAQELKVINTICNATTDLQIETRILARRVDVMFVVGGRNSANTARLAEICREAGVTTLHIETAAEIDATAVAGARFAGITAGTSTPDWIIQQVVDRLKELGGELA